MPKTNDARITADIDLAIFGKPAAEFDDYEEKIWKEWSWIGESAYREGRKIVLNKFLQRKPIYHTEFFRNKYEKMARANLERSIRRLG